MNFSLWQYLKKLLPSLLLIIAITTIVLYRFQKDLIILPDVTDNIEFEDNGSCENSTKKDIPVLDQTLTIPSNSIFFMETSYKKLTSRQACSVESAAKANPDRQIILLLTESVTFKNKAVSKLRAFRNVEIVIIKLSKYFNGTALFEKFTNKLMARQRVNLEFIDLLKFFTIYKYGGVYLSLDVIVARSFNDLKHNWVVKESTTSISSDMFSFSQDESGKLISKIVLDIIIEDLNSSEQENLKDSNPSTMNKVIGLWCATTNLLYASTDVCEDLQVMQHEKFFPITFQYKHKYYQDGDLSELLRNNPYTFKVWKHSRIEKIPHNSLYRSIAKEFCPNVYNLYGDNFGL